METVLCKSTFMSIDIRPYFLNDNAEKLVCLEARYINKKIKKYKVLLLLIIFFHHQGIRKHYDLCSII
jgi:hypothetical protein